LILYGYFSIPIFHCPVRFLLRSQLYFRYFFPVALFSCSFWSSVSSHSYSMWSRDRYVSQEEHSGLLTLSNLRLWVALVYPVLSLDIATCILSLAFLLHLVDSVFSSLVSCFEVFFGQPILQVVWRVSFSTFFAAWSTFSLPGIVLWLGTHWRVIFGPSWSNIFLMVCVLGFFVGMRLSAAIFVLNKSVIITISCLLFLYDWIALIIADCSALKKVFLSRIIFLIVCSSLTIAYPTLSPIFDPSKNILFVIIFVKRSGRFRIIAFAADSWFKRAEPDVH
jgi:hypothetical protein